MAIDSVRSGVYEILNTVNSKSYIGSAVNIEKRWCQHKSMLLASCHNNCHLQSAWNKYKEEAFEFGILSRVPREELIAEEQYWMDLHCSYNPNFGYNKAPKAGNTLGVKHTDEARAKISAARMGGTHTGEARNKISVGQMGNQYALGHIVSAEVRAKISAAQMGRTLTEETRNKISAAKMGKILTAESRAKISASLMGNQRSLGIKHTDETRAKLSAASTCYWAAKKNVGII